MQTCDIFKFYVRPSAVVFGAKLHQTEEVQVVNAF